MNKKVWTAMLVLTVVFLCFLYIAKIFFPQDFVMCIENERLIQIGSFIDNCKPLYYVFTTITSFATYYLFCCACCHKIKLKLKEILMILASILIVEIVSWYDMNLYTHISISSFIILPTLMKADLKTTSFVYFTHGLSQMLSLSIRNLPMYITNYNIFTIFVLSIDMYFWLLLLVIIFNYKKEE